MDEPKIEVDPLKGTLLGKMRDLLSSVETDYLKARTGNRAAGVRVRHKMVELRELIKPLRKEIIAYRERNSGE